MKCLRNNVILAIGKKKEVSEGGIILTPGAQGDADTCKVLMVGPEAKGVRVGDLVLKPEVTIIASKRGNDCDFEMPDGTKCAVVEDTDIRVVMDVPVEDLVDDEDVVKDEEICDTCDR